MRYLFLLLLNAAVLAPPVPSEAAPRPEPSSLRAEGPLSGRTVVLDPGHQLGSHHFPRRWGPCVDVRGRAGNRIHADLKLSIHGDGSYARGAHGFHVIAPTDRRPWTHDIFAASRRLALTERAALHRAGLPYATYLAGGDGLDFRSDLATLNLSDVPTVMVELGNMRDPGDARQMTSPSGQARDARALVAGIRQELDR